MLVVKTKLMASPIHGIGVFLAQEAVKAGDPIWVEASGFDATFTDEQVSQLPPVALSFLNTYAHYENGSWKLDIDNGRHMNHSFSPNVACLPDGSMVAARDILNGEELTCNYMEFDHDYIAAGKMDFDPR